MKGTMKTLRLAGILAGSLIGVMASIGSAPALPLAHVQTQSADVVPTTLKYYGDGYRRPYRQYYGYRRYRGPAGLYRCGGSEARTHLERRACR